MSKSSHKLFEPITTPAELKAETDRAGRDFVREYIEELTDNFDQFRTKELKNQYLDYFYNCCFSGKCTKKELRERTDIALRIIESGMADEAVKYASGRDTEE